MIRLYECLRHEHDWRLVLLAAVICLASSFAASVILDRVKNRSGITSIIWLVTISIIVGFGIWATHFVAMLAYEPGVGFSFDLVKTVLSLLIIIGISFPAFSIIANSQNRFIRGIGAAILGLGISAMHYSGMNGLLPSGIMVWDKAYIAVSMISGCVFTVVAIDMHKVFEKLKSHIICALLLTLGICSTHFFGMSALTLVPFGANTSIESGLSPVVLGTLIGALAIIVLQAGIVSAIFDSWLSQKTIAEEWKTHEHETLLSSMGEIAKIGAWELDIMTMKPHWSRQTRTLHRMDKSLNLDLETAASHFPGDAKNKFLRAVDRACHEGKGFDIELPFQTKDSESLWVRVVCKTLVQNGQPAKLIGAYQDITHHKNERDILENALQEADKANKLKSEFLANMSHEIRTPLNGVLGMTQLLEKTNLDAKQRKFTETIFSSGTSLLSLINDVLDISKIEAGLLVLENDAFDLEELLSDVKSSVIGIAMQKGIGIEQKREDETQGVYFGDAQRIKQVLINLLGNGLKFTEKGTITLSVKPTDNNYLRFEVVDTGPGIAKDQQKAIFRRFTQADGTITRKHGGTGLGLTISQDLVELMGGSIGIHSKLGEGATFWFQIPLKPADTVVKQMAHSLRETHASVTLFGNDEAESLRENYKILLAEDNHTNQEMIAESLKLIGGVELSIVDNGAEAIKNLESEDYNLVLMDINMPIMSGDEAMKRIRSSSMPFADIPIVVLTANAMAGQKEKYLNAGATAYLSKPLDVDQLISTVRDMMLPSTKTLTPPTRAMQSIR